MVTHHPHLINLAETNMIEKRRERKREKMTSRSLFLLVQIP